MNFKGISIFIVLIIVCSFISAMNTTYTAFFLSRSMERPFVTSVAMAGAGIETMFLGSQIRSLLDNIDEKLNVTIGPDVKRGLFWELALREKTNEKISNIENKFPLGYSTTMTFAEILIFNWNYTWGVYKTEKYRIDDVIASTLDTSLLTSEQSLITTYIDSVYSSVCNKPTKECNQKFLEKISKINKKLESNITLSEESPKIKEELKNCTGYRVYAKYKNMESKLNYYMNENVDEISKLNGLLLLKTFKDCNKKMHENLINLTYCIEPNNVIKAMLSSSLTMSTYAIMATCHTHNTFNQITELEKYE